MAIKSIETITVNGGPAGEAFGCKIFQMSLEVGFDKEPTNLTLNVVREDGIYPDWGPYTSYFTYNIIKINNVNLYMYLVKTSSRTTPESKTVTMEFVDGSHILDRVFVGMINKHTTNKGQMITGDAEFEVPVCCPDCHGDPYADLSTTGKMITNVRQVSYASMQPIGNNFEGGFIFVGEEEYTESDCDIGRFSYNFRALVIACKNIGIHLDFPNAEFYDVFRREHTGTLRSVLRAWCSELNFTFSWNFTNISQVVSFLDLTDRSVTSSSGLRAPISSIKAIANDKSRLEYTDSFTGEHHSPVVLDISDSSSLKETSKSYQVTFFQSSNKTASHDREINYLQHFAGLYLDDIVHSYELGKSQSVPGSIAPPTSIGGRVLLDYAQFFTSLAISRVNQYAADIFNCYHGYVGYLGYDNWVKIPDGSVTINGKKYKDLKKSIIGYNSAGANSPSKMLAEYWKRVFRLPDDMARAGYAEPTVANGGIALQWFDLFVAITAPKYSDVRPAPHTKEYEKTIGDTFAGQHWYSYARPKSGRTCTKSLIYDVQVQYNPSPELIYSPDKTEPAKDITQVNKNAPWYDLIGPRYGMQTMIWPQPPINGTRTVWTTTPIRVIKRDAKWGDRTTVDTATIDGHYVRKGSPMSELTKNSCGADIFEQFKPIISSLNSSQAGQSSATPKKWVKYIFDYLKQGIANPVAHGCTDDPFQGYKLDIVICPKAFIASKFMNVVPVMRYTSNDPYQYTDPSLWSFNSMNNDEEKTYINNVPRDEPPNCVPTCDIQRAMIQDEACDCDPSIVSGPGDISSQTVEFQDQLFSPSNNEHAPGIYSAQTYGATLSFCRDNPWVDFLAHGKKAADTTLFIGLPVGSFRTSVTKGTLLGVAGSLPIPTTATWNLTDWYRANFKETISITYYLPKETSAMNTFENYDAQGRNWALPGSVARINVQENDVTSQLNIVDGNCGGDSQVINMYLPNVGFITMESYHNLYTNLLLGTGSEIARETVSITFAGLNIGTLYQYTNVIDGLASWSISMSSDGYQSQLSWQNKPRTYPSQELNMVALKPNIIRQVF